MQQEYQFVETKYPTEDPNSDLDFDDKLLYHYLSGQTKNLNKLVNDETPYIDVNKTTIKSERTPPQKSPVVSFQISSFYRFIFVFFVLVGGILWVWYSYRPKQSHSITVDLESGDNELSLDSSFFGTDFQINKKNNPALI